MGASLKSAPVNQFFDFLFGTLPFFRDHMPGRLTSSVLQVLADVERCQKGIYSVLPQIALTPKKENCIEMSCDRRSVLQTDNGVAANLRFTMLFRFPCELFAEILRLRTTYVAYDRYSAVIQFDQYPFKMLAMTGCQRAAHQHMQKIR